MKIEITVAKKTEDRKTYTGDSFQWPDGYYEPIKSDGSTFSALEAVAKIDGRVYFASDGKWRKATNGMLSYTYLRVPARLTLKLVDESHDFS